MRLGIGYLHVPALSLACGLLLAVSQPGHTQSYPEKPVRMVLAYAAGGNADLLARDLPTAAESGLRGYDAGIWNGILAPARTPQAVVDRLHAAIVKIVMSPDVKERIIGMGADPMVSTPAEFTAYIAAEIQKWGKVIKDSGAKLDSASQRQA